ncbi:MAG TPA: DUF721 domain-containing protein [Ginsengibacter sp.]|nr:DUF721 domain-containing protein [Chitinophagaceae bacterium]HRN73706.1 DUF721 domain-containing protein [Ginsengibacter sp.]HRP18821.1 DUF721 domain-containing protein [Ginsengibacter sp.]HRP45234.1 DUF721 domain-containing protein [Ginsengibacter sp.]
MELSLGDAIKKFLNESRIKGGIQSLQIKEVWAELMGKTIANYTKEIAIVNNKLIIYTDVAPLKTELQYQKSKIIERINERFGEKMIEEVIIK